MLLSQLNKAFQAEESPSVIYCISMQWFREWEAFVKGKDNGKDLTLGVCQGRGGVETTPFAGSWLSTAPAWGEKAGQFRHQPLELPAGPQGRTKMIKRS